MTKLFIIIITFSLIIHKSLFAEIIEINNDKIKNLIKSGVPIIDIRTENEWQTTGVIPNSNLITFFDNSGKYDLKSWLAEIKHINPDFKSIILICRSGRRSHIVAEMINQSFNYPIYDASGGMNSWVESKLKVIKP